MVRYLVGRLMHALWALAGVVLVVFILINASGDPAALLVSPEAPNADEVIADLRQRLGYDRPVYVQFVLAVRRIARGDFGESIHRRPALRTVTERLPATLKLAGLALLLAAVIGIPLGALAAIRRGRALDKVAMTFSLLGLTLPSFWLSIILILLFALRLGWLPAFGGSTPTHIILPALALAPYSMAVIARITRSSMLEVLGKDYVRTARAKGLAEATVVFRHALRNAALPIVTMLGLRAGVLLSGAIIVETVFAYPGAGQMVIQAVQWRDLTVVTAFVMVFATIIILINLATDFLYVYLDPRIRLTGLSHR